MQFSRWVAAAAGALALFGPTVAVQHATAETSRIVVAQQDKPSGSGTINSVDAAGHKVNMTHGPVAALKWPGMTMDFPVAADIEGRGARAVRARDAEPVDLRERHVE